MYGPPARGLRLDWSHLPERLLHALQDWLGSPIVAAEAQLSGFSPAIASRIRCANGRRAFVKAVGTELNPDSAGIYRRERAIVESLPPTLPVPRLLWSLDEGDDGWVMNVFQDVEGSHPSQPWNIGELTRVLQTLVEVHQLLSPSPIDVRHASHLFETRLCGWQSLAKEPSENLDPWSRRHLETLAPLESRAAEAVEGETLLHMDFRADNLLLSEDRVWVVDWPDASIGAPWVDVVAFAPSVTMQGGPAPEEILAFHPSAREADPKSITALVAAIAGYFTRNGALPSPPGLPTLRPFQQAQGVVARRWLAQRTGLT